MSEVINVGKRLSSHWGLITSDESGDVEPVKCLVTKCSSGHIIVTVIASWMKNWFVKRIPIAQGDVYVAQLVLENNGYVKIDETEIDLVMNFEDPDCPIVKVNGKIIVGHPDANLNLIDNL